VKAAPRSVMILLGAPKRCVMSPINFVGSSVVTFATGRTSIHLVNLLMATRINLQPLGRCEMVLRSQDPTWRRAMMEGWCTGPEPVGAAVWQRLGIFCTS
jgi:hypothetical protein